MARITNIEWRIRLVENEWRALTEVTIPAMPVTDLPAWLATLPPGGEVDDHAYGGHPLIQWDRPATPEEIEVGRAELIERQKATVESYEYGLQYARAELDKTLRTP